MANRIGTTILMLLVVAFFVSAMFGCSAVSSLPSMQHCDKVVYERNGTKIVIAAECTAPVGGM